MIRQKYLHDYTEWEKEITDNRIISFDLSGINKESEKNCYFAELYVHVSVLVLNLWCLVCKAIRFQTFEVFFNIQSVYKRMVQFQKLTRNLFLTLPGHNVHRQQRQLSKFLMRYQQLAFHAYCGAAGPVYKMASQQEKAFCVLRFEVSRSVITVQREFRAARFRKVPATRVATRVAGNWLQDWHLPRHQGCTYRAPVM